MKHENRPDGNLGSLRNLHGTIGIRNRGTVLCKERLDISTLPLYLLSTCPQRASCCARVCPNMALSRKYWSPRLVTLASVLPVSRCMASWWDTTKEKDVCIIPWSKYLHKSVPGNLRSWVANSDSLVTNHLFSSQISWPIEFPIKTILYITHRLSHKTKMWTGA